MSDLLIFGAFRIFRAVFLFLPRNACLAAGRLLGSLFFYADAKHCRLALTNLETAFGRERTPDDRRKTALAAFRLFGQVMADNLKWMHLHDRQRLRLLTFEGEDHLRRALAQGRGVLLFSAHFGNWEVASLPVSRLGRLNVVARPLDNTLLERELVQFRNALGARVISKFQAARPVLQSLRRNEIVAILIDQNVLRYQAVFVDFFGRPAATTPALASFFLRTQSPLLPIFCYPTRTFSYRVKIGEPITAQLSGNLVQDVLKITQLCTKMIEFEIRENPSLWFWFHNRWKTQPENAARPPEAARPEPDA